MTTCPKCQASDGDFLVEEVLVAKPLGTFSLAGSQPKVSAYRTLQMSHSCGWSTFGFIEGNHFYAKKEPDE